MNAHTKFETGRMTSKGQVLIPKAVREAIGLAPNAPYKISVNGANRAEISPVGYGPEDAEERVRRIREGLAMLRGTGKSGKSTDEIMSELRGDGEP
jgi:antitoxin PrlF